MAKQDVLDAINATIAPNNIKGITAESLNNVLTMMTENAGEGGSGDGALRVIVPELVMLGGELVDFGELSPASWEEIKSLAEADGVDMSEYDAVIKTSFEHNANVAQQIIEKGKAGQGVSVVLDQTPYFSPAMNAVLQMNPETAAFYEDFAFCGVQPAGLYMQYTKPTPEGEAMVGGDVFDCVLAPTGNTDIDGMSTAYPSNMLIFLNLDGSLTFIPIEEEQPSSGSGVVFYTTLSGEITEEQKEKNVASFSKYAAGIPVSVIVTNEGVDATYHPFVTMTDAVSDYLSCSFPIKKSDGSYAAMLFYEDGSVVMQME
jgi:hypothetical protein